MLRQEYSVFVPNNMGKPDACVHFERLLSVLDDLFQVFCALIMNTLIVSTG